MRLVVSRLRHRPKALYSGLKCLPHVSLRSVFIVAADGDGGAGGIGSAGAAKIDITATNVWISIIVKQGIVVVFGFRLFLN